MIYTTLGNTDTKVSKICLGTMTWGVQNNEQEAFEQMDCAIDYGVNFFDTAEMYPIPPSKMSQGLTETYIGNWFIKEKKRSEVILATKASGPGLTLSHIRKGPNYSKTQLTTALNDSLKRLKTDYIDLYQLHWPERHTNFFGRRNYSHISDDTGTDFSDVLMTLHDFVKAGKIRHYGLSNETPWGVMKFIEAANQLQIPKPVSIQNPYNLLNRTFEIGLSEIAIREKVGLLAYSPLAMGVLSGKYLNNTPENARLTLYKQYSRYSNAQATKATQQYVELANSNGIKPSQMALAFIHQQKFVTSNIIGATTIQQLKENIESLDIKLPEMIQTVIETIHNTQPNPAP